MPIIIRMESLACSKQSFNLNSHSFVIITIIFSFFCTCLAEETDFIKNSCNATQYPDLCYQTLSPYNATIQTSPTQLANAALSVTLESAESTSNFVVEFQNAHKLKPREAGAIKDCIENMKDSVDELQQSMVAMKSIDGPDFEMEMSNIQTWVSAALTYENTCMDGFEEHAMNEKVKEAIRSHIVRVAQFTSIALALINQLR